MCIYGFCLLVFVTVLGWGRERQRERDRDRDSVCVCEKRGSHSEAFDQFLSFFLSFLSFLLFLWEFFLFLPMGCVMSFFCGGNYCGDCVEGIIDYVQLEWRRRDGGTLSGRASVGTMDICRDCISADTMIHSCRQTIDVVHTFPYLWWNRWFLRGKIRSCIMYWFEPYFFLDFPFSVSVDVLLFFLFFFFTNPCAPDLAWSTEVRVSFRVFRLC